MLKKASLWTILTGLFLLPFAANSQTAPTINTFTVTPSAVNSGQSTVLAWTTSNATSCTASGGWTGTKATNGSETITNITANRSFTLTCTGAATTTPGTASLRWTPPTQNTDGSTLTNLASYRVLYGTSSSNLDRTVNVASPSTTSYQVGNLSTGTYYFAVRSVNSSGTESANSNLATKVVNTSTTTPLTATRTANVTVNTTTPTGQLVVVNTTVFNLGTFNVTQWKVGRNLAFGVVPLGTPCDATRPATDNYYVVPKERVNFNMGRGTLNWPIALCARQ